MEAASKTKRGRPAFRNADHIVGPQYPRIRTARHRQNLLLENKAVVALRLLDYAKAVQNGEEPTGEVAGAAGFV